jgi:hypothetical protein
MSKRLLSLVPILAGIAGYFGYALYKEGFLGSVNERTQGTLARKGATLNLTPADQELQEKLQPFIVCINRVDRRMQANIALYGTLFKALAAKPLAPAPVAIETFRGFKVEVFETNNTFSLECASGLEKAMSLAPVDATLDAAAATYASTLRSLIPLLNEADLYYAQKDYVDDKMVKGRKLDAQLAPLFGTLIKTSNEMRVGVAERDDRLQESRLAAIEKQLGKTLNWHTLNVMIEARKAIAGLDSSGPVPGREAIVQMEQRLQVAFDAARATASTSPPLTGNAPKPMWFSIDSYAADVLAAVKELRREFEAGKSPRELSTAHNRVVSAYNSLVRSHNMLGRYQ